MSHEDIVRRVVEENLLEPEIEDDETRLFPKSSSSEKKKPGVSEKGRTLIWPYMITTEVKNSGVTVRLYYMGQNYDKLIAKNTGFDKREALETVARIKEILTEEAGITRN